MRAIAFIKLTDRKVDEYKTREEAEDEISKILQKDKFDRIVETYQDELRVVINYKLLENINVNTDLDEDIDTEKSDRRVRLWVEKLGIAHLQDMFPSQLSRGQRQRTAIARTLATQPDLLILDEPFSALDAPTREALQNLTLDLHATSGLTTIIVTHDIEVAVIIGKRILILNEGTNRDLRIIENENAGSQGYRYLTGFRDKCEVLHQILGDLL